MAWQTSYDAARDVGSPGPGPQPGSARAGLRRTWPQRLLLSLGVVTAIACLGASGFAVLQTNRINSIQSFGVGELPLVEVADGQPQNWLLVGSDAGRDGVPGNRTDTIMVIRVDPTGQHLDVLSLQRDLWVPIAGTNGSERINTAYGTDATPRRLIDTIKLNFDIDVNHYVEIDFRTFQTVVDAVGGVPMWFDQPMRDQASGLFVYDAPGCVTLDGGQALAFARARHLQYMENGRWKDDPLSDLSRISRQQVFMRRMFSRAAGKATTNPLIISQLVGAANEYVKKDASVDLDEAGAMVRKFSSFQGDSIKTWSLPTTDFKTAGGAQVLKLVPEGTAPILNVFKGLDGRDADPRTVKFSVRNGSGKAGQAAQVVAAYKAVGYQATADEAPVAPLPRTTVRHGFSGQEAAAQIERHLSAGADIVPDPELGLGEVVVVTGADLTTVMRRPRPWAPLMPAADPDPTVPGGTGQTTTTAKGKGATTTATTAPPATNNNNGDDVVGIVPGEAPPGVDCK